MSGFCIPLSSNQICQTVCESYNRLINNYAGPLCKSSCANSGFLIRDGCGGYGLMVANSGYNFAKNSISFINNCDVFINYASGRNFALNATSCSPVVFWSDANLSLGSRRTLPGLNGIHIWNNNPSITLNDLDCIPNHVLSFKNCLGFSYFEITQTQNQTNINALKNINFLSCSISSLILSGNKIAINSIPSNLYNLNFSGNSLFSGGNYLFNGNICSSGLFIFNEKNSITGNNFTVNSCSLFTKPVTFNNQIKAQNICAAEIFGSSILSPSANFFNLNVNNKITSTCLAILNCAVFNESAFIKNLSGCCVSSQCSNLGNVNARFLNISGLYLNGYLNTFTTGVQCSVSCMSTIIANCCIDIKSPTIKYTGTFTGINCLNASKAYFLNTGIGFNTYISCLDLYCGDFKSFAYNSGSGTFSYVGDLNAENLITASNFLQTCNSNNVTFNTDCFTIGSTNPITIKCGEILNSKNTVKSFGILCFSNCSLACYTGYNLKSFSLGTQISGNPFCFGGCSSVFVINFCNPIKYPFSTSFTSILDPSCESPTGLASSDPFKETLPEICQSRNPQFNLMFCGLTSCCATSNWNCWSQFCNNCSYYSIAVLLTTIDYCFTPISNRMFNFTILGQT
jgi:hypothetical protein